MLRVSPSRSSRSSTAVVIAFAGFCAESCGAVAGGWSNRTPESSPISSTRDRTLPLMRKMLSGTPRRVAAAPRSLSGSTLSRWSMTASNRTPPEFTCRPRRPSERSSQASTIPWMAEKRCWRPGTSRSAPISRTGAGSGSCPTRSATAFCTSGQESPRPVIPRMESTSPTSKSFR